MLRLTAAMATSTYPAGTTHLERTHRHAESGTTTRLSATAAR